MPKRIGKYELGKTLGSGTFSKVKEGTDVETGKKYAVKIVDKQQLTTGQMEQQLKREIAIMKLLSHRNVLKMVDVLQTAKNIYLILDLLTGGDLFDKLDSAKRFKEDEARKYFQQLISGLFYLHQQGIAHRDLKPENLLLDEEGNVFIADFGFSRLLNNQQLLKTVCGTPNYMAPEVLKEQGYDGKKADIWSAGVILYAMLAGYLPFDHPNFSVLCEQIEKGEYHTSRKFSDNAANLIQRMLCVDPDKRISLDEIIQHPFFTPGFDSDYFKKAMGIVVEPTDEQIDGAWTQVKE
ncbi:CBL-interacting serine/threonine-protein kinase 23 [Diplonema papillatum]|nr:CBL-interacting serine/threonine-protein kinase 23 [Diplonema papillatum]